MEARMSILFFGKKTKNESDKSLSIYLRVTINGERFEVSTQRYVKPAKWFSVASKVKGSSEEARSINQHLDSLKQKVYDYQKAIIQEGKIFTKETLRNKWFGLHERTHTLVEVLLSAGYAYVPYSSLEAVIENSKEGYYLGLRQTQGTLRSDNPNWQPWILFFLKALKQQKQRLEVKLEREKLLLGQLPELSLKILELVKSRGRITIGDIVVLTEANRNTIKKHLEALVNDRHLQKHGVGKGTWYSLG